MTQASVNPYLPPREPASFRPPPSTILAGENAVVWTLWLTYGAFYFCRTNISAAVPGLKASVAALFSSAPC